MPVQFALSTNKYLFLVTWTGTFQTASRALYNTPCLQQLCYCCSDGTVYGCGSTEYGQLPYLKFTAGAAGTEPAQPHDMDTDGDSRNEVTVPTTLSLLLCLPWLLGAMAQLCSPEPLMNCQTTGIHASLTGQLLATPLLGDDVASAATLTADADVLPAPVTSCQVGGCVYAPRCVTACLPCDATTLLQLAPANACKAPLRNWSATLMVICTVSATASQQYSNASSGRMLLTEPG